MAKTFTRLGLALTLLAGALVTGGPADAAPGQVTIRDNQFDPKRIRIDPGDSVTWSYPGGRNRHNVTSDKKGLFNSGTITPGESFTHTFEKKGYYRYFCRQHGARGGVGMWGEVLVGNVEPPDDGVGEGADRPKLVVPSEFPTIQGAVDSAQPGSTIVIRPGTYRESVHVTTSRLVIRGVDRFRTILNGEDNRSNGITIDGVRNVKVLNLTVRNYTSNGIYFNNSIGYTVTRVDSINNRIYGLYAFDSYDGVIRNSFAWGSGDAGIYVGQCLGCAALIDNVYASWNLLGYSGTNATGVVIRDSTFVNNAVGLFPNSLPFEGDEPNRYTLMLNNVIKDNNNVEIRAASIWEQMGVPTGTGVWLFGVHDNTVQANRIKNHDRYGVLVTHGIDQESVPIDNSTIGNFIRDSGIYDLAWDGSGSNNCFSNNDIKGATSHPEMQELYACSNRPFAGAPHPGVEADVAAAIGSGSTRGGREAPEPNRPSCQRGRPGCKRRP